MNCYEQKLTDGQSEFGLHIGFVETRESPASGHGFHLTHGHVPVTSFPSNQLLSEFHLIIDLLFHAIFHVSSKVDARHFLVQLSDEFHFERVVGTHLQHHSVQDDRQKLTFHVLQNIGDGQMLVRALNGSNLSTTELGCYPLCQL